jgi:hypothetical protein
MNEKVIQLGVWVKIIGGIENENKKNIDYIFVSIDDGSCFCGGACERERVRR